MKIKIIQIGKNKDHYIDEGVEEYLKRLQGFADVEIVTLKEIPASKTFKIEKSVEEEGGQIMKQLAGDDFVIVLDEKGKEPTSKEFAKFIDDKKNRGINLVFIIGGPYGLFENVKKRANSILSLSKLTFTHQMIRPFLLEQIYRAFAIISGKDYHH
jgi:23S rRNA (pseudouridine1915-N3)-methyltransferase